MKNLAKKEGFFNVFATLFFSLFLSLILISCGGEGGGGKDSTPNASNDGGGEGTSDPTILAISTEKGSGFTVSTVDSVTGEAKAVIWETDNVSETKLTKTLDPSLDAVVVTAKDIPGKKCDVKEKHITLQKGKENLVEFTYTDAPTTGTLVVKWETGNSTIGEFLEVELFQLTDDEKPYRTIWDETKVLGGEKNTPVTADNLTPAKYMLRVSDRQGMPTGSAQIYPLIETGIMNCTVKYHISDKEHPYTISCDGKTWK